MRALTNSIDGHSPCLLTGSVLCRFACSVSCNNLTYGGEDMTGIIQLCEALKTNGSLKTLKCAATHPPKPCSR